MAEWNANVDKFILKACFNIQALRDFLAFKYKIRINLIFESERYIKSAL